MQVSNHDIIASAQNVTWPTATFSRSGYANHVALVYSERHHIDGRVIDAQHAEFFVLDHSVELGELGVSLEKSFNASLKSGEPARTYIRALVLGPATGHVFERTPMSNQDGELFKCAGCGLVVTGRPNLFGQAFQKPYTLVSPTNKDARRVYNSPCSSIRTLPLQRKKLAVHQPHLL